MKWDLRTKQMFDMMEFVENIISMEASNLYIENEGFKETVNNFDKMEEVEEMHQLWIHLGETAKYFRKRRYQIHPF